MTRVDDKQTDRPDSQPCPANQSTNPPTGVLQGQGYFLPQKPQLPRVENWLDSVKKNKISSTSFDFVK